MMISGDTAAPTLVVITRAITTDASGSRSVAAMVAAITVATAGPSGNPGRCEATRPPTAPTKIAGNTGPPRKLPIDAAHANPFGLRWRDVDLDLGRLLIDKQLQRVKGGYEFVDLKTEASKAPLELTAAQVELRRPTGGGS